ncbi:MAG TPA: SUMF1/EgtB/PvdO family nonheme iron enzyme, partial [Polyangiales bacterium]|nr:SUMF1/EgtB/PvdO family nonheme iron enzyme [Polyangiales bacterium]
MTPARWALQTAVAAALIAPAAGSCAPTERAQARATQAPAVAAPAKPQPAPKAPTDAIAIPAGELTLGSMPGSSGRDPALEADLVSLQLPAFEIDRLPYPNDLAQPYRTGVDRDEAVALCAQRGKRLCSELEWERACKAGNDALYPTGATLDLAACKREPAQCATAEGVLALGIAQREWTASSVAAGLGNPLRSSVVRGASTDAAPAQHRCAARAGATPDTRDADLGFRCCRGDGAEVAYPSEPARELTRPLALERDAIRAALA